MLEALLLALWGVFCIFDVLGPSLFQAGRPLIAGTVAGVIVGEPTLGMAIGATLELAALGVYQYGGATIPDYQTGAIVGTALAAEVAGSNAEQIALGLSVGVPAALLLASLDPVGRFLPTFWIHRADRYAAEGNARGLTLMHWTAFLPMALTRAVPTFLASLAAQATVRDVQEAIPEGLIRGMTLVGAMLPAVGFAMLLRMMPIGRHWYMLLFGFVLFAYLDVPLLGIAIFGVAVAGLYMSLRPRPSEEAAHV